ncbi:unnamed protein product [Cylicocyclus nassatus]|uniref:Uncharacterized protein n=1 Tax=Cylicocyclus nassatus TaxID=53992 RepID=A0AA36GLM0_CYLNA|nr:unnamed protein product [Cylicocyclus nassatus]
MCAMLCRSAVLPLLITLPMFSVAQLPVCSRVQACAARLNIFPLVEEDSSGWGSGLVPLYDEAFESVTFDYSQTPETSEFELCQCANNGTCDTDVDSRTLNLDDTVQLTFCNDVHEQLPMQCRGQRGLPRIIGTPHPSGETVSAVTSTAIFCTCPSGYERLRPEYWGGAEISISYKCK